MTKRILSTINETSDLSNFLDGSQGSISSGNKVIKYLTDNLKYLADNGVKCRNTNNQNTNNNLNINQQKIFTAENNTKNIRGKKLIKPSSSSNSKKNKQRDLLNKNIVRNSSYYLGLTNEDFYLYESVDESKPSIKNYDFKVKTLSSILENQKSVSSNKRTSNVGLIDFDQQISNNIKKDPSPSYFCFIKSFIRIDSICCCR